MWRERRGTLLKVGRVLSLRPWLRVAARMLVLRVLSCVWLRMCALGRRLRLPYFGAGGASIIYFYDPDPILDFLKRASAVRGDADCRVRARRRAVGVRCVWHCALRTGVARWQVSHEDASRYDPVDTRDAAARAPRGAPRPPLSSTRRHERYVARACCGSFGYFLILVKPYRRVELYRIAGGCMLCAPLELRAVSLPAGRARMDYGHMQHTVHTRTRKHALSWAHTHAQVRPSLRT